MNVFIKVLSVTMVAICSTASAQEPIASQSAAHAALTPPGKMPAEKSSTLSERMKFGYESNGIGRRLNRSLHRGSDNLLRCMAGTGDAGAAKALWHRLAGDETGLGRMPEAHDIALEQFRLIGHTFLIDMTADRYRGAATDECGYSDNRCLVGNENFRKSAAWYRLGEKLGDPVCASGLRQLQRLAKPDLEVAERDAEALLVSTQPSPDAVERYAYECRERQR